MPTDRACSEFGEGWGASLRTVIRDGDPQWQLPDFVQDLGDVLYDMPEQAPRERFIDHAQLIADGMAALGWTFTRTEDA